MLQDIKCVSQQVQSKNLNTKVVQKMAKKFDLKNCIKNLPKSPGVYIYRNKTGKVIYVGKAVNLKSRVSSYFQNKNLDPKTIELIKNIAKIDTLETASEFEALVLEAELIKRYKPRYNIDWKDDKNYAYIKFSTEKYPRVSVVHQITDSSAKYIGPFVNVKAMRTILKLARRVFPYCTCGLKSDEICLYYHLGLCSGHGEKYISQKEYAKNLKGLTNLFSGKTEKLQKELMGDMKKVSKDKNFEKAAEFRDKLHYLKRIERTHLFSDRDLSVDSGLSELAKHLNLEKIPQKIESFDISNILGTAATGSMVVFRNGVASPKDYRRFQIKTVKGANDVAMMVEILARRFSLGESKKKDKAFSDLPDLIILDGGKGQLSAVLNYAKIPDGVTVIALAKRHEEIYTIANHQLPITKTVIPSRVEESLKAISPHASLGRNDKIEFHKIILPREGEAIFLVQRIRDEAHRFAVSYHRKLKSREAFESSLDGIIGVGPKTKKKLIAKYGSINKIKEAKVKDIAETVGGKLAKRIKEEL